mmetsp:Transcript_29077/g.70138  ORF Transcript_29077/g.70138 Transcript_29077/m.70138 type:complete len:256 (-) Transcript_29077:718-1485(-)
MDAPTNKETLVVSTFLGLGIPISSVREMYLPGQLNSDTESSPPRCPHLSSLAKQFPYPITPIRHLLQRIRLLSITIIITGRPHGDQLLRTGGMYADGVIKIILRRAHLDGNGNPLGHLPGAVGGNVTAHHALRLRLHNDLEERVRLALRERVLHRPEAALVHINVLEFFGGLLLAVAHGTDLGRREDRRGHVLVVHGPVQSPEERVGETVSLHQRHGREGDAIGNVSHGVNVGNVRLRILVHGDEGTLRLDSRVI